MNIEWKTLIDDAKSRYKKTKLEIKREKEIGKILEKEKKALIALRTHTLLGEEEEEEEEDTKEKKSKD